VVGGCDRFERMLKVAVLEIKGGKVRLGFETDADAPIHRSEVWERVQSGAPRNGMAESAEGRFV
jgi:carbon storage regulator CsrA